MHLPEVLPDENLYSLLARIAAVNGLADHLQVFEKLFDLKAPTSIVGAEVGIDRFCSRTHGVYGAISNIKSKLTIYPLLMHLNVSPERSPNQATRLNGSKLDYSGNIWNEWRECPKCRNEDESTLGFSYWRRLHQLPTTYYCSSHGEPLRRTIIPRKYLHDRFWLPHELDPQTVVRESILIESDVAMALCKIGEDAINDDSEVFHPNVIRDTFYGAIRKRHLLTSAGKIRMQECINDFYNSISGSTLPEFSIQKLLTGLQVSKSSVPIQHYVLLVYWLFKTWGYFKECCKWVAAINFPDGSCNRNDVALTFDEKTWQMMLNNYRQVCLNYMRGNPEVTRAEFLKQEYKCFRWLLRNDTKWLDHHLPLQYKKDVQLVLFSG